MTTNASCAKHKLCGNYSYVTTICSTETIARRGGGHQATRGPRICAAGPRPTAALGEGSPPHRRRPGPLTEAPAQRPAPDGARPPDRGPPGRDPLDEGSPP